MKGGSSMIWKNIPFIILTFALFTGILTGCGGKKELPPLDIPELSADTKLTQYSDNEHGYYFHYPKDWKLYDQLKTLKNEEEKKRTGNQKTILVSPFEGNNIESLNISVLSQFHDKVEAKLNEDFIKQTKNAYEQSGHKVISIKLDTFKGKYPAVISKLSKPVNDFTEVTKQYIFIVGTRLFIISLQGWEEFYSEFEGNLDLFLDKLYIQE